MPRDLTVRVHSVAEDGLPDMDALTGRVAFIFDGSVVSGWPLSDGRYNPPRWEADSDVGRVTQFEGVTHWVEFPEPLHRIEKPST